MSKENKRIGSVGERFEDKTDEEGTKSKARLTVAFRLHEDVVNGLEDAFTKLRVAGLRTKQVNMREDIVKLGLEHFDELLARYGAGSSDSDASSEAATSEPPEREAHRSRGKIRQGLRG